ncbi:uncharacterized protein LOC133348250 [Lethenteron reissneri]|uniref:uncharacterized protein LOC133348250 n=1 Tax=Lethenteron reissneri TaxID=7753 RepID=UPI002AB7EBAB|nr:uncharacterized protein LOC133348250 [Lethenteron reissneri]
MEPLLTLAPLLLAAIAPAVRGCPPHCSCFRRTSEVFCDSANLTSVPSALPAHTVRLSLDRNAIASHNLDLRCFAWLRSLHVGSNGLTAFPRALPPSLTSVDVKGNNLTSLGRDTFAGLKSLRTLDLEGNQITLVDDRAFSDLRGLQDLNLRGNQLRSVPANLPPSLVKIDLSRNNIVQLTGAVFWGLLNLASLILSDNAVQRLPERTFDHLTSLSRISLEGNPWVCDCAIVYLYQWLWDTRKKNRVVCDSPQRLRLRALLTLSLGDICPVDRPPDDHVTSTLSTHTPALSPTKISERFHVDAVRDSTGLVVNTPPLSTTIFQSIEGIPVHGYLPQNRASAETAAPQLHQSRSGREFPQNSLMPSMGLCSPSPAAQQSMQWSPSPPSPQEVTSTWHGSTMTARGPPSTDVADPRHHVQPVPSIPEMGRACDGTKKGARCFSLKSNLSDGEEDERDDGSRSTTAGAPRPSLLQQQQQQPWSSDCGASCSSSSGVVSQPLSFTWGTAEGPLGPTRTPHALAHGEPSSAPAGGTQAAVAEATPAWRATGTPGGGLPLQGGHSARQKRTIAIMVLVVLLVGALAVLCWRLVLWPCFVRPAAAAAGRGPRATQGSPRSQQGTRPDISRVEGTKGPMARSLLLPWCILLLLLPDSGAATKCVSTSLWKQCDCLGATVNCAGLGMRQAPSGVVPNASEVLLQNNLLVNVSNVFANWSTLLSLNMSTNLFGGFPVGLPPSLTSLDLTRNVILSVDPWASGKLKSLSRLYLNNNQLSSVKEGFFESLPALTFVSLHSNQWTCDSSNSYLWNWLNNTNVTVPQDVICMLPLSIRGTKMKDQPASYFAPTVAPTTPPTTPAATSSSLPSSSPGPSSPSLSTTPSSPLSSAATSSLPSILTSTSAASSITSSPVSASSVALAQAASSVGITSTLLMPTPTLATSPNLATSPLPSALQSRVSTSQASSSPALPLGSSSLQASSSTDPSLIISSTSSIPPTMVSSTPPLALTSSQSPATSASLSTAPMVPTPSQSIISAVFTSVAGSASALLLSPVSTVSTTSTSTITSLMASSTVDPTAVTITSSTAITSSMGIATLGTATPQLSSITSPTVSTTDIYNSNSLNSVLAFTSTSSVQVTVYSSPSSSSLPSSSLLQTSYLGMLSSSSSSASYPTVVTPSIEMLSGIFYISTHTSGPSSSTSSFNSASPISTSGPTSSSFISASLISIQVPHPPPPASILPLQSPPQVPHPPASFLPLQSPPRVPHPPPPASFLPLQSPPQVPHPPA